MLITFVDEVLKDVLNKDLDISQTVFILPSKRAGAFLKHSLSRMVDKTLFAPEILSIEQFIENVSLLKNISNTELLFELYQTYLSSTPKDQVQEFDEFCKWAQIMLQDFNEIDRYLIDPDKILNYLSAIKEVNHWSLSSEKTELIENYLVFWKRLPLYYTQLTNRLIDKGKGYQGLQYREAVNKLEIFLQHDQGKHYVFLGFNALNASEQRIIQELLHQNVANIYWDIDRYFANSSFHDAGLFIRRHKQWPFFQRNSFNWESDFYSKPKKIHTIGIPKNVGQAKYVGELLAQSDISAGKIINSAVVLGDESLLTPLLNSLPKEIGPVNVTMGLPLDQIPLAILFESLFRMHKVSSKNKIYYKNVLSITSNHLIAQILDVSNEENINQVHQVISSNNITHVNIEQLKSFFPHNSKLIELLFKDWQEDPKLAIDHCSDIITYIKNSLAQNREDNKLSLEYAFRFNEVFNQIKSTIDETDFIKNIKTLYSLYKEVLASEKIDFQGEPLQGLQVLGMLESRVIDFETVIFTSVNEGILPSGKNNNSFIPFDVKLEYGLPTYKEKDAVYTYHFYHLLQRAKNVFILYNTEVDAFNGGEKSRFITQLESEGIHEIIDYLITPQVKASTKKLKIINKSEDIIKKLEEVANDGFSPSSLTTYIRNPIDFYYQKVLGLKSFDDVEETVATNTFGTILHESLEKLYEPYLSSILTEDIIKKMKSKVNDTVRAHFVKEFKEGDISTGKNLIAFEITKRYIKNFLNKELDGIKAGNQIEVLALEKKMKVKLEIPELRFPVFLRGTVDRIDKFNDVLRVIDYKSGKVTQGKVEIVNWEDITSDYDKYSKSFQILAYSLMMFQESNDIGKLEAGIISFKNLASGFLKFAKKDAPRSKNKDSMITETTIAEYLGQLNNLILEIFDPAVDFIEKEV